MTAWCSQLCQVLGERTRWRGENWNPDLSRESLIEELGVDVAVKAEWDEARRKHDQDLRKARKLIAEDAFQTTRRVLAMDRELTHPEGTEVRAIAAYHDLDEGKKHLGKLSRRPNPTRSRWDSWLLWSASGCWFR